MTPTDKDVMEARRLRLEAQHSRDFMQHIDVLVSLVEKVCRERDRLKVRVDALYSARCELKDSLADEASKAMRAQGEKAALVEALKKIGYEPIGHPEASAVEVLAGCVEIARAALKAAGVDL